MPRRQGSHGGLGPLRHTTRKDRGRAPPKAPVAGFARRPRAKLAHTHTTHTHTTQRTTHNTHNTHTHTARIVAP
eukprot:1480454-Pyramimonas_sp.AAC.1